MARQDRLKIIHALQQRRQSFLISYVTSTRPNLEVSMAMDSVRKIFEHLRAIGKPKDEVKVDLFLHSNGGDGTVPWRLVTLIREYANRLAVLVPFRAFSAATLTALGADAIVMHPMGMLGPTDATVGNDFNPPDPRNAARLLGISGEDVTSFISLITDDAGIQHEDQLVEVVKVLAEKVHPLALGHVKRSLSQSRMMARKLLSQHMDAVGDNHEITEIVDKLTSRLYYHGHPINRSEGKDEVGIHTIEQPSPEVESLMWDLYAEYETEMKMETPFDVAREFIAAFPAQPANNSLNVTPLRRARLVFIESAVQSDVLTMEYELAGAKNPAGATNVTVISRGQVWEVDKTQLAPADAPKVRTAPVAEQTPQTKNSV